MTKWVSILVLVAVGGCSGGRPELTQDEAYRRLLFLLERAKPPYLVDQTGGAREEKAGVNQFRSEVVKRDAGLTKSASGCSSDRGGRLATTHLLYSLAIQQIIR